MFSVNDKTIFFLIAIILLALFLRIPGVFWGQNIFGQNYTLNPDEITHITIAKQFAYYSVPSASSHVRGFGNQLGFFLLFFKELDDFQISLIGRIISVFYGSSTVLLIYFFSLEFFNDRRIALLSSLFLALTPIHTKFSHFALADVSNVFWICLSLFLFLIFARKKNMLYFLLAVFCAGAAFASKTTVITLIPVIYFIFKSTKKAELSVYGICGFCFGFLLFNSPLFLLQQLNINLLRVSNDVFFQASHFNQLLSPILTYNNFITGVGIPLFILSIIGFILLFKAYLKNKKMMIFNEKFIIVIIPLMAYFLSMLLFVIPFERYVLPLIPFFIMLSAMGFISIKNKFNLNKKTVILVLLVICSYQVTLVTFNEMRFIHDAREEAGEWMTNNIPKDSFIEIRPYTIIPPAFKYAVDPFYQKDKYQELSKMEFKEKYLVITKGYYGRFIFKDYLHSKELPDCKDFYNLKWGRDCKFIQELFKGETDYIKIKEFKYKHLMLERYLTLFNTSKEPDVIIFKKPI
ncbi:glycosyltransferase family 39 protein [Candidatus Micrarchaeota archaeon]|nr:glycosyltransferase family 39 protein [Candidatus Micrarchaeota archaeon]